LEYGKGIVLTVDYMIYIGIDVAKKKFDYYVIDMN